MKQLLTTLLIVVSSVLSYADINEIKPIYSVKFKIVDKISTESLCPSDVNCVVDGTIVTVGYELACDEKLISFDYKASSNGTSADLVMSVVTTSATRPTDATCYGLSYVRESLELVNVFGEVTVTSLGTKK